MFSSSHHSPEDQMNVCHSDQSHHQARRKVSFKPKTSVYLVECLDDFSQEEIDTIWTTASDSKSSQEDLFKSIAALRRGAQDNDEQSICFLGIEHFQSLASMEERNNHKLQALDAVLDEQTRVLSSSDENDRPNSCPNHDIEWKMIAAAASLASRKSTDVAIMAAAKLAAKVKLAFRHDHKEK